jgi:hypothetical protein
VATLFASPALVPTWQHSLHLLSKSRRSTTLRSPVQVPTVSLVFVPRWQHFVYLLSKSRCFTTLLLSPVQVSRCHHSLFTSCQSSIIPSSLSLPPVQVQMWHYNSCISRSSSDVAQYCFHLLESSPLRSLCKTNFREQCTHQLRLLNVQVPIVRVS